MYSCMHVVMLVCSCEVSGKTDIMADRDKIGKTRVTADRDNIEFPLCPFRTKRRPFQHINTFHLIFVKL